MRKELVKKILKSGITLVGYLILRNAEMEKETYASDQFFWSETEDLKKKGLLSDNNKLTLNGRNHIRAIVEDSALMGFCEQLYKKIQFKMIQLTGRNQKRIQNRYNFIPNLKDFQSKLQKVIDKYEIDDLEKVEKVLLKYIYDSYQANFDKVMLLDYYIMKNDMSKFITDYENFDDKDAREEKIKTDGGVYLI